MVHDKSLEKDDLKSNPEKVYLKESDEATLIAFFGNDEALVSKRIRMLWYVREFVDKVLAVRLLEGGLKSTSVLLQHEICYVMGQIMDSSALPILQRVLNDASYDVMTRHEAGEAIGAIGDKEAIPILAPYLKSENRILRETCELAIQNIEYASKEGKQVEDKDFNCVDPAPPFSLKETNLDQLETTFLNEETTLFNRYRAMFALRNYIVDKQSDEEGSLRAIHILCKGFALEKEGALFKHEIGFVMGQLQDPRAREALETVLRNTTQHAMVRHEVAEALGSISDDKSLSILKEYTSDADGPVADSCEVALDMHAYYSQFNTTL